ncbi:MAG TPA: DUF488 domain-containing protein [Deltaproteobacteria bacterium]|nr:DUF488 domain-containing protein [Deltaproteobacteria bacterium]HQB38438.1 DUF488 domain-containing protein [Deltaproteobacteria bacterium]
MKAFTIGFTKKNAQQFFNLLKQPGLKRVLDIRLNNVSQLAGFTKRDDLRYFLREICGVDYFHLPELAPSKEILDAYKKAKEDWLVYETRFHALMLQRKIENRVRREIVDGGCFLCSESTPEKCHRRLVVEYLQEKWGDLEIQHL